MMDEEGYIYVMSRTDDVINIAGHRLSCGHIEEVCQPVLLYKFLHVVKLRPAMHMITVVEYVGTICQPYVIVIK